jgi:hypothetical protein
MLSVVMLGRRSQDRWSHPTNFLAPHAYLRWRFDAYADVFALNAQNSHDNFVVDPYALVPLPA